MDHFCILLEPGEGEDKHFTLRFQDNDAKIFQFRAKTKDLALSWKTEI
jgi:hypothetical protein